jgi:hypothetical protein
MDRCPARRVRRDAVKDESLEGSLRVMDIAVLLLQGAER